MKIFILLLIVASLVLTSCTNLAGSATTNLNSNSNVKEFNVVIGHTFYHPNKFVVKKNDTVRFLALASPRTSNHVHGITIDDYGINEAVSVDDPSNPKVIEFVANKPGNFTIWCRTCWEGPFGHGHPDIRATLVVEE